MQIAATIDLVQGLPDRAEVAAREVVERGLVGRELAVDLGCLRHEGLDGRAGVADEPPQGELAVDARIGTVVPPGAGGGEFEVRLDQARGRGVDGLRVVVGRGHAGLLLIADHVHDRRVLVVVAEGVVGPLLVDLRVEVVPLPVGVVVVDPEPAEVGVAVHGLEEQVVRVLAEAVPCGEVDVAALVGGVRRRVEPLVAALVVPLGVVGHVEDRLEALGLGRGDQLAEEVPLGRTAAGDLGGPGAGIAEPGVEGGQDQVLGVQLLGFPHPVVRAPAAAGHIVLPAAAAGVGRCGALPPVQEKAGGGAPQEVLAGVDHIGTGGGSWQGDHGSEEQRQDGQNAQVQASSPSHAGPSR